MKENVTIDIGSVALIDKVDGQLGLFDKLFKGIKDKSGILKETTKLLVANRFGGCIAVSRLPSLHKQEFFELLGFKKAPSESPIFRNIKKIGKLFPILLERYQQIIKQQNLVSVEQFMDFSSTYLEGSESELAALGYSRDHRPGKKQITFGVSTGINGIPTALTIQKGNVQDKKHFQTLLKVSKAVLEKESMLVFDCGANTKENKRSIRALNFHYLTLKPKHRGPYKQSLQVFNTFLPKQSIVFNDVEYQCVKHLNGSEWNYIYFSKKAFDEQLAVKERKHQKQLKNNDKLLPKVREGKVLDTLVSSEGYIQTVGKLQKTIDVIPNDCITGLEGYFILESDVDCEPEKVLALYKNRDMAEKLFRNMKEGTELHPLRHWSDDAIKGYLFVVFLTNCIKSLALLFSKNPLVKNVKLLKKYLSNLALTIIYPKNSLKIRLLSNITPEIQSILGDSILKYGSTDLKNRW